VAHYGRRGLDTAGKAKELIGALRKEANEPTASGCMNNSVSFTIECCGS
jgi:hypothetical protein